MDDVGEDIQRDDSKIGSADGARCLDVDVLLYGQGRAASHPRHGGDHDDADGYYDVTIGAAELESRSDEGHDGQGQ